MKGQASFSLRETWWWLLGLSLLVSACGYRFSVEGYGPQIGAMRPEDTGPLVPLLIRDFGNQTLQTNLEFKFTRYVRQEFAASSGAKLVHDEGQADYVMKGEIVSVTVPALAFSTAQARENRVQVLVKVTVEDRKTGAIVWSDSVSGSAEFFVNQSSDTATGEDQLQFNQVLQDRALEQAGREVAEILASDFWDARDRGTFSPPREKSIKSSTLSRANGLEGRGTKSRNLPSSFKGSMGYQVHVPPSLAIVVNLDFVQGERPSTFCV